MVNILAYRLEEESCVKGSALKKVAVLTLVTVVIVAAFAFEFLNQYRPLQVQGMFTVPSGLSSFFNDNFAEGYVSPYLWNLTLNPNYYSPGVLPSVTSNPALVAYSCVITGKTYEPMASNEENYSVYGSDPWTQISTWTGQNSTEVWTQQWVFVPAVVSVPEGYVSFSLLTSQIDWFILGVMLNTATGNIEVWCQQNGNYNTNKVAVCSCPLGRWFQITTNAKIASNATSDNGVYQVWLGEKEVLDLKNVHNYFDYDMSAQYIWSYESFIESDHNPSNMTYYLDNVSLYAPAT